MQIITPIGMRADVFPTDTSIEKPDNVGKFLSYSSFRCVEGGCFIIFFPLGLCSRTVDTANSNTSFLRRTNTPLPPAEIFRAGRIFLSIHRLIVSGCLLRNRAVSETDSISFTAPPSIAH